MKIRVWIILLFISTGTAQGQEPISLEECRDMALKHNKQIKIAEEKELAVGSLRKSAKTQFYPKFSFNGGYFRTNKELNLFNEDMYIPIVPDEVYQNGMDVLDPQTNPDLVRETFVTDDFDGVPVPKEDPKTGNPLFENYAYLPQDEATIDMKNVFFGNIGMTQPIYTGGKIRETHNIAKYGEKMMESKKNISQSEVILETDKRYWKVISLKEKVTLAEDYLKRIDTLLNDVKNLHEEGIITENKVTKVTVKKDQIQLKLTKAKNGLELARMALNQTIGAPLDSTVRLSDSIGEVYELKNSQDYVNSALSERSELNALNNGVKMAESGEELMKSRYKPNIGLTANYTMMNPNPYNGFENEFGGDINVGVMVNIPIYHWGDKKHTLEAARHNKKASVHKLEESKEKISLEVRKTIFSYREAIKKVEMTKSSLEHAEENLEMTKNNFDEGITKLADVLEAQSMWQEAYSEYIEAKTEFKLTETELQKASGQLNEFVKK
ncbi:MAG: TolC family protein [Bacteroidota bacterium]